MLKITEEIMLYVANNDCVINMKDPDDVWCTDDFIRINDLADVLDEWFKREVPKDE